MKKVFVKYEADGQYEELPYGEIGEPLGSERQHKKYYSVADNSLFIFPTPKKYVEDGIIVHGVNTLRDVEIDATEAKIWGKRMPSRAFEALALGMAVYYTKYRKRDFAEADKLEVEYEKEINRLVQTMKARSVRIVENEAVPVRTDLQ